MCQVTLTSLVSVVLDRTDSSFVLANARVVDYPAVYCNDGFCKLSGYSRAELMQRGANCSFMAGELTNRETIRRIDACLENNEQEQVEILLYKKNSKSLDQCTRRRPFWSEASTTRLHLTRAQPLGGRGGLDSPKIWTDHPNFLMKSVITVTQQPAVHEDGHSIRILFCTIT